MNRKLRVLVLCAAAVPALSACFPVLIAGGAGAAMVATDRRTSGTVLDDNSIEVKVEGRVSQQLGDSSHVNAVSFNKAVLLAGEVPTDSAKQEAERQARAVPGVRKIYNEIVISPASSFGSKANDAALTAKVKANLLGETNVSANNIKVYSEAGTVFLMGIVYRGEGTAASNIASGTSGVQKVVTLFEYLD